MSGIVWEPLSMGIIKVIALIVLWAVAALWIFLIGIAQKNCSLLPSIGNQCRGPELDVWMLPFFTAPFGGVAVLTLIIIGFFRLFR
jgi:hypothetical protein